MADNQERHYNILKLNRVFAISSLVFFAVWILVFVYDFQRPWKKYQIEFRKLEIEKIRQDLSTESAALEKNSTFNQLVQDLSGAEKKLTVRQNELDEIVLQLEIFDAELYKNNQLYQFAKADLDVLKYEYEKSQFGHGSISDIEGKYLSLVNNVNKYFLVKQNSESKIETMKIQEREIRKEIDDINNSLNALQVVVNDLEEDLVYMGMPKVDRCMTCHVGIDKAGFEDAPQPYKTHPKLDFMVGPNSAHPVSEFGCTSCHSGRGRGTKFYTAAHTPNDEEMAHRWEKELGWEPMHYWENPMLPKKYTEAGCYKCHSGNMPLKEAETLSPG